MRVSTVVWGLAFIGVGVGLVAGWFGSVGTTGTAMGATLLTLGILALAVPTTTWIIARTTRPEDYKGSCPVGRVCEACGAFTFYPRDDCKSCHADLAPAPVLGRSESEPL